MIKRVTDDKPKILTVLRCTAFTLSEAFYSSCLSATSGDAPTGVVVWDVTLCAGFLVSDVSDNHGAATTLYVLLHVEHEATTIV
jgi:hypothetical protein